MRTPGKRERAEKQEVVPSAGGTIASSSDLKSGDRVVYPKQGVYRVTGLEQKDIAGQRLEFVRMTREENGASVLVPLGKVATIGLRRVASADDIEGVFHYLGASYDDPELDWKVRHRDNVERLIAGGVLGVAEVVKGLHSLSRLRPLPAKERDFLPKPVHLGLESHPLVDAVGRHPSGEGEGEVGEGDRLHRRGADAGGPTPWKREVPAEPRVEHERPPGESRLRAFRRREKRRWFWTGEPYPLSVLGW